jgi:HAD superfamily hydrolase (TIGR01459 family)
MPADRLADGAVPLLAGVSEIAADYDGFILDLWGVLHDGAKPYPGAVDALGRLIAAGKRIAVLSNAPRRAAGVIKRMTEIGIAPGLYHHVLSSGEETWQHLAKRDDPFYEALGTRCYHIGSPRDEDMVEGVGFTRVTEIDEADFILNTGPWGWTETVADYEARLQSARARDVPMVCANPDLVVMHEERMAICAGALAQRYEAIGGRVRWHGKPFPSVYETCFGLLGITDRRRILAVGDSLRTDIAGANAAGIDSLLVAGGIHAEEFGARAGEVPDGARIAAAAAASGHRPQAAIARFAW